MKFVRRHFDIALGHASVAAQRIHHHAFRTPRLIAVSSAVLVLIAIVVFQFTWPADKLVMFANVDSISVGGLTKDEATKKLNDAYANATVPVFFSDDAATPKASPTLSELGVEVENEARIGVIDYPWYWRLVPTSGLWYHTMLRVAEPTLVRSAEALLIYTNTTFGEECRVEPVNATIEFKAGDLVVVPEKAGSLCDKEELTDALEGVLPSLSPATLTITGETIPAAITAAEAEVVRISVVEQISDELMIAWEGTKKSVPAATAYGWLAFSEENGSLRASVNDEARAWLTENFGGIVAIAAGVSQVTTRDFVEVSRVNGASGRALDVEATAAVLGSFFNSESQNSPVIQTRTVAPSVQYTRSYSPTDTGLSALMKNFAESRPGVYGIRLIELSGARRNASYNGDRQFTTASTYKLFVAYSTLLRIESGAWSWSDQITGGRDLARCFDDMIVKSDNPCADALLRKIGYTQITNEAKAIGASRTSFLGSDGIKSTANDEALLLSLLQTGQILSQQSSRNTFISALQRNVYRQGIPKGIPSATVANKVGFLEALLHDAAIVTAPTGTYVLVILTEGSSWAAIADLAREIEALRLQ